jgi:hypothetical protein
MAQAGEIRRGKHGRYFHLNIPVTPVTPVTLGKKANKSKDLESDSQSDRSDVCHFPSHTPNASNINKIDTQSDKVTGVTAVSKDAPLAPDYLGPPGDDPADFLGDIPPFLRRT